VILELATERQRIVALQLTTEKKICGFRACNKEEKRREHKSLGCQQDHFHHHAVTRLWIMMRV
jgi:hypothetical protein